MSKFAILTMVRPGPWEDIGKITVNSEQVVAMEEEPGGGGSFTRLTLPGGRTVSVRGKYATISSFIVAQATNNDRKHRHISLFEDIFGVGWDRPRRGIL